MIEIEGLPEGWKAVAYRVPKGNIEFVFIENVVRKAKPQDKKCFIVEKIKPREIRLEETAEKNNTGNCQVFLSQNEDGILTRISIASDLIWREAKENS